MRDSIELYHGFAKDVADEIATRTDMETWVPRPQEYLDTTDPTSGSAIAECQLRNSDEYPEDIDAAGYAVGVEVDIERNHYGELELTIETSVYVDGGYWGVKQLLRVFH